MSQISRDILSDITVHMKYAKYIPELNRRETWEELVTRNKKMHQAKFPKLKEEIEETYKLVYDKKVLPSMRSLQFGGKPIEISPNRLYNCSYLPIDHTDSFSECMFLLLSGCGRLAGIVLVLLHRPVRSVVHLILRPDQEVINCHLLTFSDRLQFLLERIPHEQVRQSQDLPL